MTASVLTPKRPRLHDALDVAESVAPKCTTCDGTGAQQERQTCLRCDGRGFELDDVTRAAELWEALATRDVIPLEAVSDPRRAWVHAYPVRDVQIVAEDGTPTQAWARTGGMTVLLEHPPTVAECVAFASDWANVLAAEAVAREVTGASRALWCIAPAADVAGRIMSISPRHSTAAVHALGYVVRSWSFHDVTLWCPALDGARA